LFERDAKAKLCFLRLLRSQASFAMSILLS
jgi:hypothetical protein